MKILSWLLPLLLTSVPAWAEPGPRPITLQEAVRLARQNAPAVVQARGQERSSDAAMRSAYAAFLPNLTLTAGANRQFVGGSRTRIDSNGQTVTVPSEPWTYNAGYAANVLLFDGGRRFFDMRQAKARDVAAEVGIVNETYTATLNAKQQFFNVLAARESQGAAAAQLQQAEQQRRTSVALARAREATRSDSLRAEIQMRNAQLAVLDAQNSLEVANAGLTRAVGVDEPVTAAPESEDTTVVIHAIGLAVADADLAAMAEHGPLVQQSESLLKAARAANTASWADYLPALNMSYSRSGSAANKQFTVPDNLAYSGALRFSLSLPLFDRLQREEQHVAADVAAENAGASLRDARLAAREGLVRWLGAYRVAEERVRAQAATVDAAVEDLRVQQQRYAVGGSTLLDVLTSQTQLNQARRDLIQARYDQRVAKAQLEALIGKDL
ncbi:MAG TPA: TolC family protein [Candidatus Limnocylindrales bacterium]|nr:TolC family protein [Candidatus Limnocylindrales bacterium]